MDDALVRDFLTAAIVIGVIVVASAYFLLPGRWRPVLVILLASYLTWQFAAWPITGCKQAEIRSAAVALLSADTAVGRWPADMEGRERAFHEGADARRAALAKVWFPSVLDEHVRDWEAGLAEFYDDRSYEPYTDNRYVVTDWRSTRQKVDRVVVVFRGHMAYKDAKTGEWGGEADGTEHLTLRRIDGEWRIASENVTDWNPS